MKKAISLLFIALLSVSMFANVGLAQMNDFSAENDESIQAVTAVEAIGAEESEAPELPEEGNDKEDVSPPSESDISFPFEYTINNYYRWDETTEYVLVTITKYIGSGGDVVIPSNFFIPKHNGGFKDYSCTVTEIGNNVFSGRSDITNITMPDTVTSIGDYAFTGCNNITSIMIPSSVTELGVMALAYTGITSIQLPNSITSIGYCAFEGCYNLASIEIPYSVTSIGYCAFWGCNSLTNITIPDTVTIIDDYAFIGCNNLTSITIPASVTSIGDWAFDDCNNLTIYGYTGSVAHQYAVANGIDFVSVGVTNSYAASVELMLNGTAYDGTTKVVTLKANGTEYPMQQGNIGSDYIFSASVPNGTYTVFIDNEDTGKTITISNAAARVDINFVTLRYNIPARGMLAYEGYYGNMPLPFDENNTVTSVEVIEKEGAVLTLGLFPIMGMQYGFTWYQADWNGNPIGQPFSTDSYIYINDVSYGVSVVCIDREIP